MQILILLSFIFLSQCTEPVRRDEVPVVEAPAKPPVDLSREDLADLKKTVWVFKFANETTVTHPALQGIPVGEILKEEIQKVLGGENSPFTVQSGDEEKTLLTASQMGDQAIDPLALSRNLAGSEVSGFVLGRASLFEMGVDGEQSEGIFKMRTVSLKLEATYELYDSSTGKAVVRGRDAQQLSESRADFLGAAPALNDVETKTRTLAARIAKSVVGRLAPFSTKLAWGGRVLRIEGGRVYINSGRKTGLAMGDILKIVERPRQILDPQTGQIMGEAPGRMKGTLKIIQFFGGDSAIGILQSGGSILPGDRVELY